MIPSRRLSRVLGLVVSACAMVVICSVAGAAPDPGGPTRSTTAGLDDKRYVAAGDRAYVIGSEDGRFPPMGWHIRGRIGGAWADPIKLLDGYWPALHCSVGRLTHGCVAHKLSWYHTQYLSGVRFGPPR